ncbi:MAG: hypothetical protein ACXWUP_11520 [Allosphingosinicella sp.]
MSAAGPGAEGGSLLAEALPGLVVIAVGLSVFLATPALVRLQIYLLERQLAWMKGPWGPIFYRGFGLLILLAGLAAVLFAVMRS